MTSIRLNNLAVCHLHHQRLKSIDEGKIREAFISTKARKLEFRGSDYYNPVLIQMNYLRLKQCGNAGAATFCWIWILKRLLFGFFTSM